MCYKAMTLTEVIVSMAMTGIFFLMVLSGLDIFNFLYSDAEKKITENLSEFQIMENCSYAVQDSVLNSITDSLIILQKEYEEYRLQETIRQ